MPKNKTAVKPQGFTAVTIIYNPNSTGDSRKNAFALKRALAEVINPSIVSVVATTHAGHAEEIAYKHALASTRPLIVSSSGDGGYHEVINGALRAQAEGARVVTSLLPSGNANDHYHALHTDDVLARIAAGRSRKIDVLSFETKKDSKHTTRYAHSYIGLGVTPLVGAELNKTTLGPIKEVWIVARTLLRATSVAVEVNKRRSRYTNLIFSNIQQMSKVLTLSENASVEDGKFEVNFYKGKSRIGLFSHLLRAAARSLEAQKHVSVFRFRTIKLAKLQLDGEIITVAARSDVTVRCEPKLLRCIV